ncbi:MAG: helix-turn-helix domain-containing protein [Methylocystaceae bacterium]|nr:helix-turn-helix domain-containing protein [Methylocystaceae bacterium]
MNKQLISVQEFCTTFTLGRTRVYQMINNGDIETVKIGRSRRIKTASIEHWLNQLTQQN